MIWLGFHCWFTSFSCFRSMKSSQYSQVYYGICLFSTVKQLALKAIRIISLKGFHLSLIPFSLDYSLEVFPDNPLGLLNCAPLRPVPLTFLLCCLPILNCSAWKNGEVWMLLAFPFKKCHRIFFPVRVSVCTSPLQLSQIWHTRGYLFTSPTLLRCPSSEVTLCRLLE